MTDDEKIRYALIKLTDSLEKITILVNAITGLCYKKGLFTRDEYSQIVAQATSRIDQEIAEYREDQGE